MARSFGNMFGDLNRIPPGGQSHNTLRSMESNKSFPGNYTSMANSTPLEAASQVNISIIRIIPATVKFFLAHYTFSYQFP